MTTDNSEDALVKAVHELALEALKKGVVTPSELPKYIEAIGKSIVTVMDFSRHRREDGIEAKNDNIALPSNDGDRQADQDDDQGQRLRPATRPAVPVEESVQEDHIVCLEDGKPLRMLTRYLKTQYGLTPEEYRARWGLPPDYPMNAPSVTKAKVERARRQGLGTSEHKAQLRELRKQGIPTKLQRQRRRHTDDEPGLDLGTDQPAA